LSPDHFPWQVSMTGTEIVMAPLITSGWHWMTWNQRPRTKCVWCLCPSLLTKTRRLSNPAQENVLSPLASVSLHFVLEAHGVPLFLVFSFRTVLVCRWVERFMLFFCFMLLLNLWKGIGPCTSLRWLLVNVSLLQFVFKVISSVQALTVKSWPFHHHFEWFGFIIPKLVNCLAANRTC